MRNFYLLLIVNLTNFAKIIYLTFYQHVEMKIFTKCTFIIIPDNDVSL